MNATAADAPPPDHFSIRHVGLHPRVLSNDELVWALAWVAGFGVVFKVLDWPIIYYGVKKWYVSSNEGRSWRVRNESTSLLHATASGCWALGLFVAHTYIWEDMIGYYSAPAYWLVLFSTGYLVNDAIDLVWHERSARTAELLFHHVSIIFALMCCVLTKRFAALCACGLLMEVNSIFLHSRSLLNLTGVAKTTAVYRLVSVCNVATFIVFRLSNNVFLVVWDCLHYSVMDPFYFGVLFFVMFSMLIVNSILFYRVLLADSYVSGPPQNPLGCFLTPWQWVPLPARFPARPLRRRRRTTNASASADNDGVGVGEASLDALQERGDSECDDEKTSDVYGDAYDVFVPDESADVIP